MTQRHPTSTSGLEHCRDDRRGAEHTTAPALPDETVYSILGDPAARAVLWATNDEPLSATEIIERCNLSRSTTYRKIDHLQDLGLLEERVIPRSDGHHTSTYTHDVDSVTISIEPEGLDVRLESRD